MESCSLSVSSESERSSELADVFGAMLTLDDAKNNTQMSETEQIGKMQQQEPDKDEDDEDEEEKEEEEFSFVCLNPVVFESVISADHAFHDGQIRPLAFPVFDPSLLLSDSGNEKCGEEAGSSKYLRSAVRKVFVAGENGYSLSESESDEPEGSQEGDHCEWSGKSVVEVKESGESCKKSYSTGFSKIWRFNGRTQRSNSDGKDAFVFLNSSSSSSPEKVVEKPNTTAVKKSEDEGVRKKVKTTTSSAHEKLYVCNKAKKEVAKRRSYLPYKQDLMRFGFFTNVSSLSRNVHPY